MKRCLSVFRTKKAFLAAGCFVPRNTAFDTSSVTGGCQHGQQLERLSRDGEGMQTPCVSFAGALPECDAHVSLVAAASIGCIEHERPLTGCVILALFQLASLLKAAVFCGSLPEAPAMGPLLTVLSSLHIPGSAQSSRLLLSLLLHSSILSKVQLVAGAWLMQWEGPHS